MIIVIDDDDLFLDWMKNNPNGFVINAHRKPTSIYLKLHRSSCHTLHDQSVMNWTRDYLKACASRQNELVDWCHYWFQSPPKECSFCFRNDPIKK